MVEIGQQNNELMQSVRQEITTTFSRAGALQTKLADFQALVVLGKGTFGKVFLVRHIKTKKYYAMKAIRKDRVLEYGQLNSTLLEKQILEEIRHPFLVGLDYVF